MTFPARPLREWIMRAFHALLVAAPLAVFGLAPGASADDGATSHALSLFGDVKYPPDFKQFDYVNPDAPKAGTARFAAVGSFDNLNQFIIKGVPAAGIGSVFDTLMTQSLDEPATEYGLLAESVEVAKDRSWVIYTLRKEARFNDGSKVTPDDVIWTFETLRSKGRPQYRGYYADVGSVEPVGERGVKFILKNNDNRELPQIIGELPVLPKAWWSTREFDKTTLEPPLGSGPTRSRPSIPAARSPIAASPITGAPTCRSIAGATISMSCATTIIAIPPSRSKRSRPDNTISAWRTRRRNGRPAMRGRG